MIDDKKIEEAAINKCGFISSEFYSGAKWAINEFLKRLWHPNTEEPDKSKSDIITLGFDNDAYLQFKESILWNEESWRHSISRCQIIKWAYLSDILDIVPIPLTPEILEKNGWVKDTHHHCLDEIPAEAYKKKDFPLTYFNVTFGKKRIQASHDSLFVRNLKYVSDLQHLLFGLGINHEMEV